MDPRRPLPWIALLAAALLAGALLAAPSDAASRVVVVRPASLPPGPALRMPHVEGTTLVDGSVRIRLEATYAWLLGKAGSEYVVQVADSGGATMVEAYRADGTHRVLLARAAAVDVRLSDDGTRLVSSRYAYRARRSGVVVRDVRTLEVLAHLRFRGYVGVVDARGRRLLLTADRPARTFVHDLVTGRERTLRRRPAGFGDLTTGLFSTFTGDPYQGGCVVLARLTRPRHVLWRSCQERVEAVSSDGRRILTVALLSDGLGPSRVDLRRTDGRLLQRYRTGPAFGVTAFEPDGAVVLEVIDTDVNTVGWARCRGARCERPVG